MGILIGKDGYSTDLAFDTLKTASQSENRKLRHVATLARKGDETSTGSVVLAGLGGAGVAMFAIGTMLVVASRRRSSASTGAMS